MRIKINPNKAVPNHTDPNLPFVNKARSASSLLFPCKTGACALSSQHVATSVSRWRPGRSMEGSVVPRTGKKMDIVSDQKSQYRSFLVNGEAAMLKTLALKAEIPPTYPLDWISRQNTADSLFSGHRKFSTFRTIINSPTFHPFLSPFLS